jgi:hypothetical protein
MQHRGESKNKDCMSCEPGTVKRKGGLAVYSQPAPGNQMIARGGAKEGMAGKQRV